MQESVSNSGSTVVPGIHFAEVRARITLADVLDLLGFVPCESSGDQVRGPCLVRHSIGNERRKTDPPWGNLSA